MVKTIDLVEFLPGFPKECRPESVNAYSKSDFDKCTLLRWKISIVILWILVLIALIALLSTKKYKAAVGVFVIAGLMTGISYFFGVAAKKREFEDAQINFEQYKKAAISKGEIPMTYTEYLLINAPTDALNTTRVQTRP